MTKSVKILTLTYVFIGWQASLQSVTSNKSLVDNFITYNNNKKLTNEMKCNWPNLQIIIS